MKKIKKTISLILISILIFGRTGFGAYAQEAPTPPAPPEPPVLTEQAPTPPPPPQAPTFEEATAADPTPAPEPTPSITENTPQPTQEQPQEPRLLENFDPTAPQTIVSVPLTENSNQPVNQLDGVTADGNVGNTEVTTGNANNSAAVASFGNLNTNVAGCCEGSVSVVNNSNGSDSTNDGSVTLSDTGNTDQYNSANVLNNLDQTTLTGENSASKNTGGDSTINSGDANTSGTIVSALNTNVDGLMVSEFNVVDDHMGDIILDFGAGCVIGCGGTDATVLNSGNGSSSDNSASVITDTTNNTDQTNVGNLENNLYLFSNSGDNVASKNTGGDSTINSGDANVSANVVSFLNNNIAGNVVLGVVNVFGDLVGDIILSQEEVDRVLSSAGITAGNTGNGSGSNNTSTVNSSDESNVFQSNDSTIQNNLVMGGTTGGNTTSGNTGGNSAITTGSTTLDANILNILNSNMVGGNWWLVLVNEAGNWVGKLLGAPDGANMAGSPGTEFTVGPDGQITAVNSGNGSNSNNNTSVNTNSTNNINQNNDANIVNNLNLFANTGGNDASKNTGGNSTITTGDAKVIANIINFVNNNITGGGKVLVTVVNVFGSWLGDFVGPGQTKQNKNNNQQQQTASNSNNSSNANSESATGGAGSTLKNSPDSGANTSNNKTASSGNSPISNVVLDTAGSIAGVSKNFEGPVEEVTNKVQVAGANFSKSNTLDIPTKGDQKVTVNLAWLIFLLPLGIVYLIIKKRNERRWTIKKT